MMYEGKNIHYSSADSKLLCSFSGKLCNQRRLNGYGFCVRHILEDPTAPFKRCAYVAKSSNQMCTQAIPKHEERRYCNNHMQVLGMLPKKERKKKDKPGVAVESKLHLTNTGNVKFSLSKDNGTPVIKPAPHAGDADDPYTFLDAGPADNKAGELPTSCDSILGKSLQSGQGFVRSASDISSTARFSLSGGSTIAKFYPELAEKLEKMRAKPEIKAATKNRARSSRTMNKLQTKIAQNKINEKLRKSQELSQTDSNSSPLQISSPEQNTELEHIPSPVFSLSSRTFSPHTSGTVSLTSNRALSSYEQQQKQSTQEMPPLPQVDTSFLATLAAQDSLGFQNTANGTGLSDRLLAAHTPPRLPPPYPGSSTLSTPSSLASADLPSSAFSPQTHLNCVLESLSTSHSPQRTNITQTGPSGPSSLSSLSFPSPRPLHSNLQTPTSPGFLSPASSSSFPSSGTSNYHFPTSIGSTESQSSNMKPVNNRLSTLPHPSVDIFSMLNLNHKHLSVDPTIGLPQSNMLPSPNTLAAHLSLPPPPPYVPPAVPPKVAVAVQQSMPQSKISMPTVASSTVTPKASVPQTKLHKLTGILPEKAARRKLKSDLAVKFYSFYARRKESNHCMVGPYLASSDDDSEDGDVDMLPWQRDVFSASSDEEADEDDELGNDVPMEMRPTKLSLLKTRLRRQWCQARKAYEANRQFRTNSNQETLALIRAARDSAACAVRALWQIAHVKKSKRKLQRRVQKKKICCHRNEKEGQCQNQCLPYANHCLKHITYNINQQLFDFCTAKFANNVQCCLPSFDLRHELPLCQEHAAKTDNYQKQLELENKKKPRKKSKPPALTRPPRKGKKKKKGRYSKTQNHVTNQTSALDSALSDVDVTTVDAVKQEENLVLASTSVPQKEMVCSSSQAQPSTVAAGFTTATSATNKTLDHSIELVEALSPDFDKPFELPLEQASRLLDESDFQEVVNKMPFDALDLFGKNGEPDHESEVEHLTVDLTSASKARDAIEKLLTGTMSEEESMQIAILLAQNLPADTELAQHVGFIGEVIPGSAAQGDARMLSMPGSLGADISMNQHLMMPSVSESSILGLQTPNLNDNSGFCVAPMGLHATLQQSQPLHPHQAGILQQHSLTTHSNIPASYLHQENLKINTTSLQQTLPSVTSASAAIMDGVSSVFTADLNAIYGHISSATPAHLTPEQNHRLNLNHTTGLDNFSTSTAKTVIRHLPSSSQPATSVAGTQNLYTGSPHMVYPTDIIVTPSVAQLSQHPVSLELGRNVVHLETSVTSQGFSTASLSTVSAQSRLEPGVSFQSSSSTLSSLPSASELSDPLSLPSRAKKAKLMTSSKPSSVIQPHQHGPVQQQHVIQLRPQLTQQTVQHILQATTSPQNRILTISDASKSIKLPDKPSASPNLLTAATTKTLTSGSLSSNRRLALPGVETLQQRDSSKVGFSPSAHLTSENAKARLQSTNTLFSDISRTRLNVSDNSGAQKSVSSSVTESASFSSSRPKSVNTVRYSLTADHSLAPAASLATTLRHNLLTSPSGPTTESILVTVRQPSPLESVPSTVRHTLPDTLSTPITLPSSPSLNIASSLPLHSQDIQDFNSQTKLMQSAITTQSASLFHSELQRPHWVPVGSSITLQNGLPFAASSRAQVTHKHHPAGQGNVKSKQSNAAAEAARISALANAAGVPVVCGQVSLPGFVQGLPTTTFKTSGSS